MLFLNKKAVAFLYIIPVETFPPDKYLNFL